MGWNWVRQIARFHEVWVITRANNREPIEQALAKEPMPNVHWVYFDLPRWARFWKKAGRGIHAYYHVWHLGAYFLARKLHREVRFELAHHITFGQYWSPSFAALLPVPFIWGPIGGGESAPPAFWRDFSTRGKVFELLRDLVRAFARVNPIVRLAARRSRVAIATTEQTAKRLRMLGAEQVIVHPQFGITERETEYFGRFPTRNCRPFRIISIGRLIHWKGFHLGLRAFARFQVTYPESEYWIVNIGPEMHRLRAMAKKLGVEKKVIFWGKLPTLQDVYSKLSECDVLVHPALHEAFGNVCLEAMAAGRPVICLDLGGPALQVTEETGIKVPAIKPEQVVHDLAEAFCRLASDPELCARLSLGARKRLEEHFNWDKKGLFMTKLYESLSTVEDGMGVERKLSA